MRHHLCVLLSVLVLATLLNTVADSQEMVPHQRSVGLSASLQNSQFDILVPIWTGDLICISPAVGLIWAEDGGTDLRLGLEPRIFFYRERLAPYVGLRVGMLANSPNGGQAATDWLVGCSFGGEYFFDAHFSVGVESQLNLTISSDRSARFGNPGKKNLNSAAAVFATVYF